LRVTLGDDYNGKVMSSDPRSVSGSRRIANASRSIASTARGGGAARSGTSISRSCGQMIPSVATPKTQTSPGASTRRVSKTGGSIPAAHTREASVARGRMGSATTERRTPALSSRAMFALPSCPIPLRCFASSWPRIAPMASSRPPSGSRTPLGSYAAPAAPAGICGRSSTPRRRGGTATSPPTRGPSSPSSCPED
jgi:hypothetical protein